MKKLAIRSEKHLEESIAIVKRVSPCEIGKREARFGKLGKLEEEPRPEPQLFEMLPDRSALDGRCDPSLYQATDQYLHDNEDQPSGIANYQYYLTS